MKYEDAKTLLLQVAIDQFESTCPANRIYKAPGIKGVLKKSAVEKALRRMEEEGILEPGAPGKPRRVHSTYCPHVEEELPVQQRIPTVYIIQAHLGPDGPDTVVIGRHGTPYLVVGASDRVAAQFARHLGIEAWYLEPYPLDEVVDVARGNRLGGTLIIQSREQRSWKVKLAKFASREGDT